MSLPVALAISIPILTAFFANVAILDAPSLIAIQESSERVFIFVTASFRFPIPVTPSKNPFTTPCLPAKITALSARLPSIPIPPFNPAVAALKANNPIMIFAAVSTVFWCSFIQSPIPSRALPKPFNTFMIVPPVHEAKGFKKLSNSHFPNGFNASITEFTALIALLKVFKKAGIKSLIVKLASGNNTFL